MPHTKLLDIRSFAKPRNQRLLLTCPNKVPLLERWAIVARPRHPAEYTARDQGSGANRLRRRDTT